MWLLVFLSSCVSKGTHELTEVQLDATRIALSARNAQCYDDVTNRDAEIVGLHDELSVSHELQAALSERNAQLDQELLLVREQMAQLLTIQPGTKIDPAVEPLVKATAEEVRGAMWLKSAVDYETRRRNDAQAAWEGRFQALRDEGYAEVLQVEDHTVVRIPAKVLFNEGRVSVSPRGEKVLKDLAAALRGAPGRAIDVVAHTDDSPYHTSQFDSSWELGFAQAMRVVRSLEEAKVGFKLSAGSAAAVDPIDTNDTPEGRDKNRRIELWVEGAAGVVPGAEGGAPRP